MFSQLKDPSGRANEVAPYANALFGPFGSSKPDEISMAIVDLAADGTACPSPPRFDGYVLSVQLIDAPGRRMREGGDDVTHDLLAGDTVFHDLRRGPQVQLDTPYRALNVFVPRTAFNRVAERAKAGPFADLVYVAGAPIRDETVFNIANTLMPALRLAPRNGLFVEQLTLALLTHVAFSYGGLSSREPFQRGGLAPWQIRRTREMLLGNLNSKIALEEVAAACDLSLSHFRRAFRQSFGEAPYQFILKARVEAAKSMIRQGDLAMSEVSLACGFADQSHMTRMFSREVGVSPVAWRRAGLG